MADTLHFPRIVEGDSFGDPTHLAQLAEVRCVMLPEGICAEQLEDGVYSISGLLRLDKVKVCSTGAPLHEKLIFDIKIVDFIEEQYNGS